jgi:hypothetical protein
VYEQNGRSRVAHECPSRGADALVRPARRQTDHDYCSVDDCVDERAFVRIDEQRRGRDLDELLNRERSVCK